MENPEQGHVFYPDYGYEDKMIDNIKEQLRKLDASP